MARLVDKAEKEEEEGKAKKLRSTKKQPEQQDQQTSNHSIEPATNVVTPSTAGKAST